MNIMETAWRDGSFWIFDDGGLSKAPLRIQNDFSLGGRCPDGYRADCVVRSIAITFELPYEEVWNRLSTSRQSKIREGFKPPEFGVAENEYMFILEEQNWGWYDLQLYSDVTVQEILYALSRQNLTTRLMILAEDHLTSWQNGILRDSWDCSDELAFDLYGDIGHKDQMTEHLQSLCLVKQRD